MSSLARILRPRDDLGDLGLAVLGAPALRLHELQVVDDDEALRLVAQLPARLGADLEDRDRRRVVDPEVELRELAHGGVDRVPVGVLDVAGAHVLQVDARLGAQHALDELLGPHLEREDRDRRRRAFAALTAMLSASAVLPTDGRAARMHRSPGCSPASSLSSSLKPVGTPVTCSLRSASSSSCLNETLSSSLMSPEVAADALVGDLEDQLLGVADHLVEIVRRVVAHRDDRGARADELPQHRHALDDVGVALPVRGGGDHAGDVEQIRSCRRPPRARLWTRADPRRRGGRPGPSASAGRSSPRRCARARAGRSPPAAAWRARPRPPRARGTSRREWPARPRDCAGARGRSRHWSGS